jgi:hypothetical protein
VPNAVRDDLERQIRTQADGRVRWPHGAHEPTEATLGAISIDCGVMILVDSRQNAQHAGA